MPPLRRARYSLSALRRPRPRDKDVDEPAGTLRPVRAGGDVGDPDQSAKQIDRVQILADVAALDRALYQGAKCFRPGGLSHEAMPNAGYGLILYFSFPFRSYGSRIRVWQEAGKASRLKNRSTWRNRVAASVAFR